MTSISRQEKTSRSARKREVITETQRVIGRELAAQIETPKTLPKRIADLMLKVAPATLPHGSRL
jgi:hypothetical protein